MAKTKEKSLPAKEVQPKKVVIPSKGQLKTIANVSDEDVKKYQDEGVLVGVNPAKKTAIIKAVIAFFVVASLFGCNKAQAAVSMSDEAVLGNQRWSVQNDGDLAPGADSVYSIGESGNEVAAVYTDAVTTGSLVVGDEVVTATNVITAAESGKTFFLNSATEFVSTLPAPAVGLYYGFVVTAAPAAASYTIVTNASANVIYGSTNVATDAGGSGAIGVDEDTITFADGVAVVGDGVKVISDGTNWYVSGNATVTAGITLTQAS